MHKKLQKAREKEEKTMKILLVATLCFVSCFSAPLTTAPPATAPATAANEESANGLDLSHIDDVMMDPTAKMRKLINFFYPPVNVDVYSFIIRIPLTICRLAKAGG